jgi:hypothetical protein
MQLDFSILQTSSVDQHDNPNGRIVLALEVEQAQTMALYLAGVGLAR